jgi:hypothetical protein
VPSPVVFATTTTTTTSTSSSSRAPSGTHTRPVLLTAAPQFSTVIAPPKVDKDKTGTKKSPVKEPAIPDFLFKESRDVQKEFEDYINGGSWAVILYNDPFNKRLYVQQCLMEVCEFSEQVAEDVMLQAHNYGFAIVKECSKEDGEFFLLLSPHLLFLGALHSLPSPPLPPVPPVAAEETAKKLVERGLIAEAKEISDGGGKDDDA